MESDRVICKAYDIDKYDSYMAATLPRNVLNAFSIGGIDVYLKNGDSTFTFYAKVDRSQTQKVRHFQNTSPKKLSKNTYLLLIFLERISPKMR